MHHQKHELMKTLRFCVLATHFVYSTAFYIRTTLTLACVYTGIECMKDYSFMDVCNMSDSYEWHSVFLYRSMLVSKSTAAYILWV